MKTRKLYDKAFKERAVKYEFIDSHRYRFSVVKMADNLNVSSRSTFQRYMKLLGIRSVRTTKFRVCTTDSNHNNHIADNLLNRNFSVNEPNKVWLLDITYIKTKSGFHDLTTIIDLFDKKVVGWSQSSDMTT